MQLKVNKTTKKFFNKYSVDNFKIFVINEYTN